MRHWILAAFAATMFVGSGCDSGGPLATFDEPLALQWMTPIPPGLSSYAGYGIDQVLETDGDRVFMTDTDSVVAFDASQGEELWRIPALRPCCGVFTRIRLADGVLYVGYTDRLSALDPISGGALWTASFDHITGPSPFLIDPDRIYAPGRGTITAIARETGAIVWTTTLETRLPASLYLADGGDRICFSMSRYAGFGTSIGSGWVGCLSKASGDLIWHIESMEIDRPSLPTVSSGLLVVGTAGTSEFTTHRAIRAFDLESGAEKWRIDPGIQPLHALVSNDAFAVTCLGAGGTGTGGQRAELDPPCIAIRSSTGKLVWRTTLTRLDSGPSRLADRVYVVDAGDIVEIDLFSGALVRRIVSGETPFVTTPVIAGDRLFALTERNLHAYRRP